MNTPSQAPGPAVTAGRRGARTARRIILLMLLCVAVLGLGLEAGPGPGGAKSFSDEARQAARESARALAAQAGALGYREHAGALNAQAAALADPELVPSAPSGSGGDHPAPANTSAGGSSPTGTAAPAPDPAGYARALAEAARTNLGHAGRAEGGMARLLASVGTGQWLLAGEAARVAGLSRPAAPQPWASAAAVAPDCPPDPTGEAEARGPEPGAAGAGRAPADPYAGQAAALQAAVDAEYGAAYAYEVVQARLNARVSGAGSALADAARAHAEAGADGVALLPQVCLPALTPAPAYTLDEAFSTDPAAALAALEQALPRVYADLISLSDGQVRSWAIDRLVETAEQAAAGGRADPLPGMGSLADPLPWSSSQG